MAAKWSRHMDRKLWLPLLRLEPFPSIPESLPWGGREEMLFNWFHVTIPYTSEITILILPCISTEPSLGIPASGSDKGCAETKPTQRVEKEDMTQTTRFPWLNSKYQMGWFFLSELTPFWLNQQNPLDLLISVRQKEEGIHICEVSVVCQALR